MSDDAFMMIASAAVGRGCRIERAEFTWFLIFGGSLTLNVEAPWRLIAAGRIAVTSEDDGQKFGLPAPRDAQAFAAAIIGDRLVERLIVDRETADIQITFEGNVRLEVINNSSGYEAWLGSIGPGEPRTEFVGMGGGAVVALPTR